MIRIKPVGQSNKRIKDEKATKSTEVTKERRVSADERK